jgi:hypothetical protein
MKLLHFFDILVCFCVIQLSLWSHNLRRKPRACTLGYNFEKRPFFLSSTPKLQINEEMIFFFFEILHLEAKYLLLETLNSNDMGIFSTGPKLYHE